MEEKLEPGLPKTPDEPKPKSKQKPASQSALMDFLTHKHFQTGFNLFLFSVFFVVN